MAASLKLVQADDWITTFTGRKFYFKPGEKHDVHLEDIAHALSLCCRFNGHTQRHYSVAEHAILLARYVYNMVDDFPDRYDRARAALAALHHDSSEAYLGDFVQPLKRCFPDFKRFEADIDRAVAAKFKIADPHPAWLKVLDTRILGDERAQAMGGEADLAPLGIKLHFWPAPEAEKHFLAQHSLLSLPARVRSARSGKRTAAR